MRRWIAFVLAATCPAAMPTAVIAQPTGAVALDHLAIYVEDLERSATFYKSIFGLAEIKAPVPFARWLVMSNGTTLHIVSGRKTKLEQSKWDHFAVSCADMSEMIAKLEAAGIAWSDIDGKPTPQVRVDGVKQIFVRDPDGYWIEINDALSRQAKPK